MELPCHYFIATTRLQNPKAVKRSKSLSGNELTALSGRQNAEKVSNLGRTVGEGPPYLKIVGKVLYRLKDIEAYEEASLVRKVL